MNRYEIAMKKHAEGFNCCAAVLFAFQDKTGLTDEQSYGLASGLGGGFRMGEICGAVSGAVLVLGMLCPHNIETGKEGKAYNAKLTKLVQTRFAEKQGKTHCRDLLAQGEQYRPAVETETAPQKSCDYYILTAIEVLEEIIAEETL